MAKEADRSNGLLLACTMRPAALSSSDLHDVEFAITLTNPTGAGVAIYSDLAALDRTCGPGLFVEVLVEGQGASHQLRTIRSDYGPPGIPPAGGLSAYFKSRRATVEPGQRRSSTQRACFIPAARLKPEQLAIATLDPQAMDGFARQLPHPETSRGVLVFDRTRSEIAREMNERIDFLRAPAGARRERQVLFYPPRGRVELRFGYSHWASEVGEDVVVLGNAVALSIAPA